MVLFRSESIGQAFEYLGGMINKNLLSVPLLMNRTYYIPVFIFIMLIVEWVGRKNQFGLEKLGTTWKPVYRYAMYYAVVLLIFLFGGKEQVFIYFQF
jgi:hypothetical protein